MRIPKPKYIILIGAVCAVFTLQTALATTITFNASGSDADGKISGQANFTFGAGTLTLTLFNTEDYTTFRSAGQALSDLQFTLVNGTTTGGTLTNISGTAINIDGMGNVTSGAGVTTDEWGLNPDPAGSTTSFLLTALNGGKPDYMISPHLPSGVTQYPDANNGLQQFNPYLETDTANGSVTFTITGDFTPATTVSSASFSFGTGPETFVPGTVPESGATAMLLGMALAAVGAIRRFAMI